ncbi:carbohydrate kinase family protein [Actinomadura sp. LOL_011]|uniref:carbohydrate kinase family protein n=1 Tax=Actinomadura sp. LOL_011 TaxID=3345410 RepID=UPI003A7FBE1E
MSADGAPDAVFAGAAVWDTVAQLPRFPAADGRVLAEEIVESGGGPAATAAVAYARLAPDRPRPALIAAVGDDHRAALIREGLAAENVDTSQIVTVPGSPSASCVILVDRPRGSRAICTRPGPALRIDPGSAAARAVLSARIVLVDHLGLPAVEPLLAGLPEGAPRPLVCQDAGNLAIGRCPAGIDVFVPTLDALREAYGERDVTALLDAARADGARYVVATDGPNGAYAADDLGVHRVEGHHDVEVRSTLGAGDIFHGALVAALAHALPLPEALAYANAAAALSCRALDGRGGIPDDAETRALAARLPAIPLTRRPAGSTDEQGAM